MYTAGLNGMVPIAGGLDGQAARAQLRLAPGVSLLFLGGQPMIFCERQQKLYELNRLAGYLACQLSDGVNLDDMLSNLVRSGFPYEQARQSLGQSLRDWSRQGVLACTVQASTFSPACEQAILLADRHVLIRYFDVQVADRVRPVFAHLEKASAAQGTIYDIHRLDMLVLIGRNGEPATIVALEEAAPALKACLTDDVLRGAGSRLALHAACLLRNGGALLLSGGPGAGKTTLALQMAASGHAYGSDDITLLDAEGCVEPVSFAPAMKSGAWPLFRSAAGFGTAPVHRRLDGRRVRYLPPPTPVYRGRASIERIVVLKRKAGVPTRINPLGAAEALASLLRGASSPANGLSSAMLKGLIRAVTVADRFELEYESSSVAAEILAGLSGDAAT